jgi:hypothetical protein
VGQDNVSHYPSKHPRDAQAQFHTGHQDIRTFFSDTTAAEPTTITTPTATNISRTYLIYSPFASDFSTQEPSSLRFQATFAGSFLGAAAPVKSIGFQTSSTPITE